MTLSVAGFSIDLMRLLPALLLMVEAAMLWLLAEPLLARALPELPLPQRSSVQRVGLYLIAAVEALLAFGLFVLLDLLSRGGG